MVSHKWYRGEWVLGAAFSVGCKGGVRVQARLRERRNRELSLCGHGGREARTRSLDAFLARDSCPWTAGAHGGRGSAANLVQPQFLSFFLWLPWVFLQHAGSLVVALWTLSCSMWNPIPWPGIKPQASSVRSAESQLLDPQGSPKPCFSVGFLSPDRSAHVHSLSSLYCPSCRALPDPTGHLDP